MRFPNLMVACGGKIDDEAGSDVSESSEEQRNKIAGYSSGEKAKGGRKNRNQRKA